MRSGFQSLALSNLGYRVLALDTSRNCDLIYVRDGAGLCVAAVKTC
jgi:hypothetical protein